MYPRLIHVASYTRMYQRLIHVASYTRGTDRCKKEVEDASQRTLTIMKADEIAAHRTTDEATQPTLGLPGCSKAQCFFSNAGCDGLLIWLILHALQPYIPSPQLFRRINLRRSGSPTPTSQFLPLERPKKLKASGLPDIANVALEWGCGLSCTVRGYSYQRFEARVRLRDKLSECHWWPSEYLSPSVYSEGDGITVIKMELRPPRRDKGI